MPGKPEHVSVILQRVLKNLTNNRGETAMSTIETKYATIDRDELKRLQADSKKLEELVGFMREFFFAAEWYSSAIEWNKCDGHKWMGRFQSAIAAAQQEGKSHG